MWYLILPPLIFLGSLWLLLVFLSRRTADPTVQERLESAATEPRRLLFVKEETGLRVLEKLNQRFKVWFLKLHNASAAWSKSLKERRERFRQSPAPTLAPTDTTGNERRPAFRMRFGQGDATQATAVPTVPTPTTTEPTTGEQEPSAHSVGNGLALLRRHREAREKPKKLVSEEDLIAKIAKNPKDAVAYEELGDYYLDTHQLEDAKACYRQVIKLSPMNRGVKDKVRRLERLLTRAGR